MSFRDEKTKSYLVLRDSLKERYERGTGIGDDTLVALLHQLTEEVIQLKLEVTALQACVNKLAMDDTQSSIVKKW